MTIEIVTLETNHLFSGNPIYEQHRLRHQSIISRQDWPVPTVREMEYDQYDNPATVYLVWRDENEIARGCSRLYPTTRDFMLNEHFSYLASNIAIPSGAAVWEASRFCIDKSLDAPLRRHIAREIVVAYLEHGLRFNIEKYVGLMYPAYWRSLFVALGWQPVWLGERQRTDDGKFSRAGYVTLSQETLEKVRQQSGIRETVSYYGESVVYEKAFAA